MRLAVVLVHYRTPDLLVRSVEALRADASASDLELELVVVDNGSEAAGRRLWQGLDLRVIDPGENLGYAGGARRGVEATTAPRVVVMNPDVLVLPGCLATLSTALEGGAAAAGPRFFWDEERRFLLPPTDPVGRGWELLDVLAAGGGFWAARARRAWRRHALRHLLAADPVPSHRLSGALIALRREVWERIGPFDDGYRLYFEETDWLERLRRAGLPALHVPAAQAVHLYAQSTVAEGRAARWFEQSNRRFRRRFFGAAFTRLLEGLAGRVGAAGEPDLEEPTANAAITHWEISPSVKGYPAAVCAAVNARGRRLVGEELWGRMAPGTYYLRALDARGHELGGRRLVRPEG
jgi:GT2 family glycosyltransferase